MSQLSPPRSDPSSSATPSARPGRASALSQYVVKLVSRCDLACDHCYVYQHADQNWRRQPYVMAPATVTMTAKRIAEHATTHELESVRVVLHGGEPLLAGAAGLRRTAAELRRWLDPVTGLDLRMQSNGVLLTPEICDVLTEYDVRIGISLDGDLAANDRHRRYANGASSHARVRAALALLRRPAYRPRYAGLLCTIDLTNDPIRVYEALLAEEPPQVDFLLPHANWDRPPERPEGEPAPYAAWLLAIHRRWSADGRPMPIRLLESLLSVAAGGGSRTEAVGLTPADLAVIETDGTFEQVDSLKSAFDGAPATGLDVFAHRVDDVAAHPMIAIRQAGLAGLSATCRACPVVRQCGGGLFAHRYRSGSGFDNPSVYCADLKELIRSMSTTHPDPGGPDRPPRSDELSQPVLDDLGSGHGTDDSVRQLADIHLGKSRALLAALGARVAGVPVARDGWDLLVRLDVEAPAAVRTVLTHPFVRSWAQDCLDRPPRSAAAELPYLACVAAAAAVHAGHEAELVMPVRNGMLSLPTVGALAVGPDVDTALFTTSSGSGEFQVRAGGDIGTVRLGGAGERPHGAGERPGGAGAGPGWQPVRRVPAGGRPLLLEDTDPHRDCYHPYPVAGRLPDTAVERWTRQLDRAIRRIDAEAPGYAASVRTLLQAVVPLRPDDTGRQRSASASAAFGAVAVAPVPDDVSLAILLVHEVQHLKLNAVLDVCELYDPSDTRRIVVPWRDDPRPVGGVLHGIYAHLAVADLWRNRSRAGKRSGSAAGEHFQQYRDWTATAMDNLLDLGSLTGSGERFVGRMRETLDAWAEPSR
ncbi:FxsB family radical SAM/SPASM domain protein [Plantactinospora sp. S1510]|uniref:FxsB family radical SAM/SPASM domain protein n=1 Tax=Plantactinospora alkalitolerans TaxID=2789879 RepID=A0ABS0GTN1_9ACTN|nr:FxsB family cyclophane-forming radical SAM/SPASM peptide maturase [Plantactinospora alkalitolerans]MBF9129553.1 FxsB family radical SAM/SPASM domain protein [Plantactinospora alkalitolerans]